MEFFKHPHQHYPMKLMISICMLTQMQKLPIEGTGSETLNSALDHHLGKVQQEQEQDLGQHTFTMSHSRLWWYHHQLIKNTPSPTMSVLPNVTNEGVATK